MVLKICVLTLILGRTKILVTTNRDLKLDPSAPIPILMQKALEGIPIQNGITTTGYLRHMPIITMISADMR